MKRASIDTSLDPTHGLVRASPAGEIAIEVEQACSSLACYFLLSVVMLCPCLFLWHGEVLGGATGRMWP